MVIVLAIWGAFAADGGLPVRSLRVAVVQGGGRRGLSDLQVPASVVYAAALRATRIVRPPVDLVLWPEDVVALGRPLAGSPEAAQLAGIARRPPHDACRRRHRARRHDPVPKRDRRLLPSGALVAVFEKVHRVPFGEYVPVAIVLLPPGEPARPFPGTPSQGTGAE